MKRILGLLIALLLYCAPAFAQEVDIQHVYASSADTTTPLTTFSTGNLTGVSAGSWTKVQMTACTLFACVGTHGVLQPGTISGTLGDTYFPCGVATGTINTQTGMWFAYHSAGGTENVTLSNYESAGANLYGITTALTEFTGADPAADCNASGFSLSASTASPSVTSGSVSGSGYLVMAQCYSDYITWTAPAVAILPGTSISAYQVTSGSGAVTIAGTQSSNVAYCTISALLNAPPATTRSSMMLMGVGH